MGYLILFLSGLLAGGVNTFVGAGSLFSIPVLLLLGISSKVAVATNRLSIVFLTLMGSYSFHRYQGLKWREALSYMTIAALGSFVGAWWVALIDEELMKNMVILLMIIVLMIEIGKKRFRLDSIAFSENKRWVPLSYLFVFAIGVYGGFFGVGITIFFIVTLRYFRGLSIHEAMAYNQVIVMGLSLVASLVFVKENLIDWGAASVLASGMALGSFLTVRWVVRLDRSKVEKMFFWGVSLLLIVTVLKFKLFD